MTAEQMTDQVYSKLVCIPKARKANFFSEAPTVSFTQLDEELQEVISKLPSIHIPVRTDLMGFDDLDGNQQFYLVQNDAGDFLVDTQGYTYPRYICKLEDYSTSLDAFKYMEGIIRIADDNIFESVVRNLSLELLLEGFDKEDVFSFLQTKLNMAFEKSIKKL